MQMCPQLSDTDRHAEEVQIELLRAAPAWQKVTLLGEMCESIRLLALTGLRQRYAVDSPDQIQRRLAAILLGAELAERAYGPISRRDDV